MIRYTLALAIVMMAIPAIAQTKAAPAAGTTNMDILRQKIKSDKKLVVAQNLNLTDAEGAKFWPVYDAYQKDLQQVNQQLVTAIQAYADAYNKGPVADDKAKSLLDQAMAVDAAENKLKTELVPKVMAVLSYVGRAARRVSRSSRSGHPARATRRSAGLARGAARMAGTGGSPKTLRIAARVCAGFIGEGHSLS